MRARAGLRWAALIALTALYLAPILWMVLTAFKTEEESAASPPRVLRLPAMRVAVAAPIRPSRPCRGRSRTRRR